MLSEERINRIAYEASSTVGAGLDGTRDALRNAARTAAAEAAAAVHERLMEKVCDQCGKPFTRDRTCSWKLAAGSGAHDYGFRYHNMPVARAEYLRLHPEAGEKGQ